MLKWNYYFNEEKYSDEFTFLLKQKQISKEIPII